MKTLRTSLAALVCVAVGPVGCGGEPGGATSGLATGSDQSALYEGSGVEQWAGGIVPVCYSTTDGNNPTLLADAQNILNNYGWPVVANVQFTGWGPCGSTPVSTNAQKGGQVRVNFSAGSNGSTAYEGQSHGANTFDDVYLVSNDTVGNHFQYEVLHEFGHVLGWDHEQQRPDNWPGGPSGPETYCNQNQTNPPQVGDDVGGTYETSYFDTQSIMSYCTGNPVFLSPGDTAGVQAAYGLPTAFPSRGFNSSNAVASRGTGNLETFFAHSDGSVWDSYWYNGFAGGQWPTFELPGFAAKTVPASAYIASVSRGPSNLDVFVAGNDGAIHSAYWGGGNWGSFVYAGTAGLLTPGEQIAAVSGSSGAIDLFFAGTDKNLYWAHWSGQCGGNTATQCGWNVPQKVVSNGSIPVGAAVSAVARTPDSLDVFYIESDGAVHTSACYGFGTTGAGSCNAGSFYQAKLPTVAGCTATAGAPVAATARSENNLDIFYPSASGGLCTSYWSNGVNAWNGFQMNTNGASASGDLAAVTRSPGNLDVFWVSNNAQGTGDIHTVYWYAASGWGTYDIGGPAGGVGIQGSPIGAAARTPNNVDIFTATEQLFPTEIIAESTSYWYTGAPGWSTYATNTF